MRIVDGLLYAVAISSVWIAISMIDNDSLLVKEWIWADLDWILVGSAILLWICSQVLNDFKRLLPLWLKLILKMKVLPSEFVEQSPEIQKRKMYTIYSAAVLGFVCSWRIYSLDASIEARVGVPFHIVVFALTFILLLTGSYWRYLMKKTTEFHIYVKYEHFVILKYYTESIVVRIYKPKIRIYFFISSVTQVMRLSYYHVQFYQINCFDCNFLFQL